MSMEFQLEYKVTKDNHLRMLFWSICTPCVGLNKPTTMPYNSCGNYTCDRFNHMLHDLLKTLSKEQKSNWPLHLSFLVFAYNATPHSVTGYQTYKLMFSHKAPNVCNTWLWMAKYNGHYLQSKSVWVN